MIANIRRDGENRVELRLQNDNNTISLNFNGQTITMNMDQFYFLRECMQDFGNIIIGKPVERHEDPLEDYGGGWTLVNPNVREFPGD